MIQVLDSRNYFNLAKVNTFSCMCEAALSPLSLFRTASRQAGWFSIYRKQLMYIVNTLLTFRASIKSVKSASYHMNRFLSASACYFLSYLLISEESTTC